MTTEDRDKRLKRLGIRCWRRGTREMDLILGAFSDEKVAELADQDLTAFEALLEESDIDLYAWISEARPTPPEHEKMIGEIRDHRSGA